MKLIIFHLDFDNFNLYYNDHYQMGGGGGYEGGCEEGGEHRQQRL